MKEDPNSPALSQGVDFRGTPNATERVTEYLKPGRRRAAFPRYIKLNLPRTTKAVLLLVLAATGAAAVAVALDNWEPFKMSDIFLWALLGLSLVFVGVGVATDKRIWTAALTVPLFSLVIYALGALGNAPYVWNGGTIVQAATWNLLLIIPVVYLVLYGLMRYGMIVAYPDDQNFMD